MLYKNFMTKFLSCQYLSDDQVSELSKSQWWPSFWVVEISVITKFLSCLYLSDDQVSELSISQWWPSFWVIYISVMIKFLSCLYLSDDQVSELSISQWWPSFWVIYISVMIKFLSCHISVMIKFPFAKLLRIFFERKRKFLLSLGYIFARKNTTLRNHSQTCNDFAQYCTFPLF